MVERLAGCGSCSTFVVITIGELYLSPTSLSLVTKIAPSSFLSMMMGVWLSTSFVGGFLAGYLGTFWSSMEKGNFFLMLALISAAVGIAIALLRQPLKSVLQDQSRGSPTYCSAREVAAAFELVR